MRHRYQTEPKRRKALNAKARAYYKAERKRLLAQKVVYGKKVAERDKARRRDRYKTDPAFKAKTNASTKRYYESKPHMFRARDAKRRADQVLATPAWSDLKTIRMIYADARRLTNETGIRHEVDHLIPIKGLKVSGLHVPHNLRVIPMTDNRKKFNRFIEDIV